MNFPIFALFGVILEAVKTGEYKAAVCGVGKLLTAVTCQTLAELARTARPQTGTGDTEPLSESQLYEACETFCTQLTHETNRTRKICAEGAASDATLSPTDWISLANLVIEIFRRFIKRPANFAPTFPAAPVTSALPAAPALPSMSKPAEAETLPAPEGDGDDEEPPATDDPPAPAEKPKKKK